MIARIWRGWAIATKSDAYIRHFIGNVLPELRTLAGQRGAWLLRRDKDGTTEFVALTLWESRDAIKAFAGDEIGEAHVEPQARAVLSRFDAHVDHYEVVVSLSP